MYLLKCIVLEFANIQQCIYNQCCYVISVECTAVAWVTDSEMQTRAIVGRDYALTCNTQLWGRDCAIDAYNFIIHHEDQQLLTQKSTNSTVRFKPLRPSDVGYYTCTVSTNGFSFMSQPAFKPMRFQSKHQQHLFSHAYVLNGT